MPQLNPSPWLLIQTATWLVLLMLFLSKTLLMLTPNLPASTETCKHTISWTWPWI